jgi:hypothetical protein
VSKLVNVSLSPRHCATCLLTSHCPESASPAEHHVQYPPKSIAISYSLTHSLTHFHIPYTLTSHILYIPSKLAYNSHVFSIYLIYTIIPKIFTVQVCTCTYNVGQGLTYRNNWLNITGTPCTNSIIYNVD